jgi:hypothetical protein
MDAQATRSPLLRQQPELGLRIGTCVKRLAIIADSDCKAARIHDDCDLNLVPGLAFIGVFNDVRTRFVHCQLESLYSIVRKVCIRSMAHHKTSYLAQVAQRARYRKSEGGGSH